MNASNPSAGAPMKLALILAALVMVLDQISKWIIVESVMSPPRTIPVTGFFNLTLAYNCGVSFGFLNHAELCNSGILPWVLSLFAVAVVGGLFFWLKRQPERPLALAIGLIAGGALGNVVDRLRLGKVVDFLDFYLSGLAHWPAFNLADSAITVGVLLLLIDGLFARPGQSIK